MIPFRPFLRKLDSIHKALRYTQHYNMSQKNYFLYLEQYYSNVRANLGARVHDYTFQDVFSGIILKDRAKKRLEKNSRNTLPSHACTKHHTD